jgi:hypothetical protein
LELVNQKSEIINHKLEIENRKSKSGKVKTWKNGKIKNLHHPKSKIENRKSKTTLIRPSITSPLLSLRHSSGLSVCSHQILPFKGDQRANQQHTINILFI